MSRELILPVLAAAALIPHENSSQGNFLPQEARETAD
jgi:hypothetical protein